MPLQRLLDYESVRPDPPPFWRRNVVLWAIICLIEYCFAVVGPLFVVAGVLSLYADPSGSLRMSISGVSVQTVTGKLVWTFSSLAIGALGLRFVASAPLLQAIRRRAMPRQ
jgi:hypothetical protein